MATGAIALPQLQASLLGSGIENVILSIESLEANMPLPMALIGKGDTLPCIKKRGRTTRSL